MGQHQLSAGSPHSDTDGEVTGAANLACYLQDPDFGYQDFARRDEEQTQVFRVQVRLLHSPPIQGVGGCSWGARMAPKCPSRALPHHGTHQRAGRDGDC